MGSNQEILHLIGRDQDMFLEDVNQLSNQLSEVISKSKFLVIGGAGTIGQAVVKELFKRDPRALHVVDISENNLVELVRELRSTVGYGSGKFDTFAIDCGSIEFEALINAEGPYDYVFNLSALKHVRSESDPFTLMRMITVNIINTIRILRITKEMGAKKYFCVSTDKAANPVNMMGASKRIMELFLMRESISQNISMARFANVAFSDGSLLHGFSKRFEKRQPFSAPSDIRRYFVTAQEAGELCLLSALFGENRDIFFPKLEENLNLIPLSDIAERYILSRGYKPYLCKTEDQARDAIESLLSKNNWPCYFFQSDTTGEKSFEEFYTSNEKLDMDRFAAIGVIVNKPKFIENDLQDFLSELEKIRSRDNWNKKELLDLFKICLPDFHHVEKGRYLNQRM